MPSGEKIEPYTIAPKPTPSAAFIAIHPKPSPRAEAGSSSATNTQTIALSAVRNRRATNWQPTYAPIPGANAVAAVARLYPAIDTSSRRRRPRRSADRARNTAGTTPRNSTAIHADAAAWLRWNVARICGSAIVTMPRS